MNRCLHHALMVVHADFVRVLRCREWHDPLPTLRYVAHDNSVCFIGQLFLLGAAPIDVFKKELTLGGKVHFQHLELVLHARIILLLFDNGQV